MYIYLHSKNGLLPCRRPPFLVGPFRIASYSQVWEAVRYIYITLDAVRRGSDKRSLQWRRLVKYQRPFPYKDAILSYRADMGNVVEKTQFEGDWIEYRKDCRWNVLPMLVRRRLYIETGTGVCLHNAHYRTAISYGTNRQVSVKKKGTPSYGLVSPGCKYCYLLARSRRNTR